MRKLIVVCLLLAFVPLLAAPPRPLIYVLNPGCFPAGETTVLDVYGKNFGGKVSLMVNGKIVPTVVVAPNPAEDGGLDHLQTTVNLPVGYMYVQVRSIYGYNISFSNPLAWSYVTAPRGAIPAGTIGSNYSNDLNVNSPLPAVCNFRTRPWYQETN
jgi:hypothetical protein